MKIHFIGIGGIGVSALAQYYLAKGHKVSGSDLVSSEITDFLEKKGAKLLLGKHKAKNLPKDADLVIHSPAVLPDNPEIKKAKGFGIKIQSYPQALGELTKKYFTIAISGTHGKSTTTAMISLILVKAGLDPTVIIGTKLKEFGGSNFRAGKSPAKSKDRGASNYLVIEADEWQASFLNYWPKIIVLTNIEAEHLDYYKDLNHILRTFRKYISHLSQNGILIANKDDKNITKIIDKITKTKQKFVNNHFLTIVKKWLYYFSKQKEAETIRDILKVPGEHNVSNALAALTLARSLKIPDEISFKALSEYRGAWRRFDIKEAKVGGKKITIVSDYAHHPTEIKVTLKAAREKFLYPPKFSKGKIRRANKKIWCVFQPHQYQRTFYLFNDFVKVFSEAPVDKTAISDIYDVAGREKKEIKNKVSSEKLVKEINKSNVFYLPKEKIKKYLEKNLEGGEVVIIMGAGDIYEISDNF